MKEILNHIVTLMAERYSIDISVYDESFLQQAIVSRASDISCQNISDYFHYLEITSSESLILSDSLNNSYSEFFRNPLTFHIMEQFILPKIFSEKEKNHNSEIRIWSVGCAAGQEPYSIAMVSDNYKDNHYPHFSIRIFATDRSEKELQTARKGIYHFKTVQNSRLELVNKYFSNSGEFYSVFEKIKKIIDFSFFDLLSNDAFSPPASIYGGFNVVMCSNLLFYYKPEIHKFILSKLAASLVKGGFLITGEAETEIIKSYRGFKQCAEQSTIFIKQ